MSFLFQSTPKVIPEFTGLQVNTAVQVLPIPIIYGCPRVNINLIYYNGFSVQQVDQGGKGFLTGGKGATETEYFATILLGIGEGIIPGLLMIFQDQGVYTPATFLSPHGATFFTGTDTQLPWSYVAATWPQDARSYKDTVYWAFQGAQLDSSATVPQIDLVPEGLLKATSPLNNSTVTVTTGQYDQNGNPVSFIGNINLGDADADPAQVIYDFLTNARYGAGFPLSYINLSSLFTSADGFNSMTGDSALSTYCQAVGLAWSVVLNNVESANSILERWTKNLVVAPVWNGAMLSFIPYWDTFSGTNPGWDSTNGIGLKYFAPYTTPITTITLDQILQIDGKEDDPITFTRKNPMDVYNTVRVDFRDRTNFFNDNVVEAKDEAHVELYGIRIDRIGLANEFSLMTYANVSAQALLRRNVSIMRTFEFRLSPLWGWLDPMNVLDIPDPADWDSFISVRLISVEDQEDESIVVKAEEFPIGSQSPVLIPTSPTTPPNQGPTNTPSSPVATPVIFEPTTAMLAATGFATPQIIIGATSSIDGVLDPLFGGYNVWVSLDGVNYERLGNQQGTSTIGQLATPLNGSSSTPTPTLEVNLAASNGTLGSTTAGAAAMGKSLCVIKDASGIELLAYTTAALVSPNTYQLTGLVRGMYGTTARSFGLGSQFLYVGTDGNFFETSLPPQYVGQTFYVKLQTFNALNNYTEDLSTCEVYQYIVQGPTPVGPTPPDSMMKPVRRQPVGSDRIVRPRRPVQP